MSSTAQDICEQDSVSINSAADAAALSSCETVEGTITIGSEAAGEVSIEGPEEISGDLICEDNRGLTSLSSSTLKTIGGAFAMRNVTGITGITMPELTKAQSVDWQTLSSLESVTFSFSTADSIRVSDTFLSNLNAFSVTSLKRMEIDNNRRLAEWDSGLQTLSDELVVTSNGFDFTASFPDLVWIANMTISNVSSISLPSLQTVNGSMRFESNFFPSFSAPNLTNTVDGDISFTNNADLSNITFPALTTVGGGLLIANNTGLEAIDGFPELKTIGGAVKLRGNFTDVQLPSLNDVKGAFDIASTNDITEVCDEFSELAPNSQGGNGKIQGTFTCNSESENANDVNSDGSSSSSNDDEDAANIVGVPLVLTIAALTFSLL